MRPSRRAEFVVVLVTAVVAAGLVVVAYGRRWETVTMAQGGLPRTVLERTGAEFAPGALGFGLAGLAGALCLLATRGWARRVVAALVAVCGVGVAVTVWIGIHAPSRADLPAIPAAAVVHREHAVWPEVAVIAGIVLAVCGAAAIVRGPRWPGMGAKYDAPKRRDTEPDMWRALDRGDDPTA